MGHLFGAVVAVVVVHLHGAQVDGLMVGGHDGRLVGGQVAQDLEIVPFVLQGRLVASSNCCISNEERFSQIAKRFKLITFCCMKVCFLDISVVRLLCKSNLALFSAAAVFWHKSN